MLLTLPVKLKTLETETEYCDTKASARVSSTASLKANRGALARLDMLCSLTSAVSKIPFFPFYETATVHLISESVSTL